MDMLGLKVTIDRLAIANGVRWYGHVLRRDDDSVLRVALDLKVARESEDHEKDLEEASGGGYRKDWFEGRYPKSNKVEIRSASDLQKK